MSTQMKLAALALISSAAAIPHYGHSRFHSSYKPSGYGTGVAPSGSGYFPTGSANATAGPTGTGSLTTTVLQTDYSTATIVSTIYATRPGAGSGGASVGVADVSTGPAACGPATVYVTATNKVTVTVPAGGAYSPSSSGVEASSFAFTPASSGVEAVSSTPAAPVYGASSSAVISAAGYGGGYHHKSSSAAEASSTVPAYTPPAYIPSSAAYSAPAESSKAEALSSYSQFYTSMVTPSASATPVVPVYSASSEAPVSSATPAKSSAAAPSPSSGPSYSGGKRGLAYNDAGLCSALPGKFSYAYNWASVQSGSLPEGVKFIPTMHKPADATAEVWLKNVDTAVKGGSNAVFGFNEPDHVAQANLSPEDACTQWTSYFEPIVSAHPDVTIVGPSVTNGPAPMGLDWLSRFQKACPSATWHAANIHFYDVYDDKTVERFQSHCEEAAKTFGKPIWVTEFGLNPGSATDEQAAEFLKGAMAYMDGAASVQGYSYFMVGTGENQLNGNNAVSQAYSS